MFSYYLFLYIHIFSAILSIGPFFVLLPVVGKIRKAEENEVQTYLGVVKVAVTIVKHAGHVLVVSGLLLMWVANWNWKTPWIMMTWLVMISSIFFLASAFSPTIRKYQQSLCSKQQLVSQLTKSTWIYIGLLALMLWLMVVKPTFW